MADPYDALQQFSDDVLGLPETGYTYKDWNYNSNEKTIDAVVSGPGIEEPIAGEETFFSINFLEPVDLSKVDVEVIGPSPPRAQMFKTSATSVDISYSVEKPGAYKIDIYVGDTPVRGIPFKLTVISKDQELAMFERNVGLEESPAPAPEPGGQEDIMATLMGTLQAMQARIGQLAQQSKNPTGNSEIIAMKENIDRLKQMAALSAVVDEPSPAPVSPMYNSNSNFRMEPDTPLNLKPPAFKPVHKPSNNQQNAGRGSPREKQLRKQDPTTSSPSPKLRRERSGAQMSPASSPSLGKLARKDSNKASKESMHITIWYADGKSEKFLVRNSLTSNALKFQILKKRGIQPKDFEGYGLFSTDGRNETELTERVRPYNIQLQNGWSSSHKFVFKRIGSKKKGKKGLFGASKKNKH